MKFGNVSQTIVEVPKFFYDTIREIDALSSHHKYTNTLKNSKKYLSFPKRKHLLYSNLDINPNNNPRLKYNKLDKINQNIYLPIYKRYFTPNFKTNKDIKEEIKDSKYSSRYKIIKKFMSYKKKMNINETLSPLLREEIMDTTYNLIEKINNDYDLTLYSNFDTRSTLNNNLNSRYSVLSETIKNKKTDKEIFRKVLSNKINSLRTINPKFKEILKKITHKKNLFIKNEENKKNPEIIKNKINTILRNCTTNYLNLEKNNKENFGYTEQEQYFIDKNKSLTSRINNNKKSTIYNEFPSKTRMEFATLKKKILIPKIIIKRNFKDTDNSFIQKRKEYGTNTCRNGIYKGLLNNMWNRPLHKDAFKLESLNN